MGLTGPNGVLPRHYTELLFRLKRDAKGAEKYGAPRLARPLQSPDRVAFLPCLGKIPVLPSRTSSRDSTESTTDPFTNCLYSLVGLEAKPLRNRLRVSTGGPSTRKARRACWPGSRTWDCSDSAACSVTGHVAPWLLEAMLTDYFQLRAQVRQFQGQWLQLGKANRSSLVGDQGNNQLGVTAVVGDRVWIAEQVPDPARATPV